MQKKRADHKGAMGIDAMALGYAMKASPGPVIVRLSEGVSLSLSFSTRYDTSLNFLAQNDNEMLSSFMLFI